MQRTSNYQLPTWEKDDRIMMEDFNGMTEKLDVNLAEAKSVADGAKTTAERAEGKADAAQATADAAQGKADAAYCPDNKPYALGRYRGLLVEQTIDVGFKPSAVLIGECNTSGSIFTGAVDLSLHFANSGYTVQKFLNFTDNGFSLENQSGQDIPHVNFSGENYLYIAFR